MSKMKELAAIFGRKLNEPFKVENLDKNYRFTENGLEWEDEGVWRRSLAINIEAFLTGRAKIVEEPWKPENRDTYYIVHYLVDVEKLTWYNNEIDKWNYKYKNCFKTKEEAQKYGENVIDHMESMESILRRQDESQKTTDVKETAKDTEDYRNEQESPGERCRWMLQLLTKWIFKL